MRVSDFFGNLIHFNVHANKKKSWENQLSHCGSSFLHEFPSSGIFAQYLVLSTPRELILADTVFFSFVASFFLPL